jgi:hypothetical protein
VGGSVAVIAGCLGLALLRKALAVSRKRVSEANRLGAIEEALSEFECLEPDLRKRAGCDAAGIAWAPTPQKKKAQSCTARNQDSVLFWIRTTTHACHLESGSIDENCSRRPARYRRRRRGCSRIS